MTAPSTGLELLRLALTEMEAADPRALQVETGASQAIGCRAESLFRLLGVPESDSRLRLDALIGKAAHAYAEEALKKVADRFELLVEHRASYRGVPCTIDLGWVGAAKLIDWKFPRKSKISWMQKNGIGNGYRGQIHLGGAALRAEGYDIQTVGLACLARDGEFDEAVEFVEPFDQQIADAAADRVAEERARATEMEGILDRLAVDEAGKAVEVRHAIDMWQLRDEDLFFCRSFCLAGETEIVTRQGLRPISDLAGSKPELLIPVAHRGGIGSRTVWKNCEVRSFGHQPLMRIKLRRIRATKIVFATPEHRWLTRDGSKVITSDLKDGMKLRSIRRGDIDHLVQVAPGVAQGFVYGDGHVPSNGGAGLLNIYDASHKQSMFDFFQSSRKVKTPKGWLIPALPRFWKEAPDLRESRSFLLSWLSGYFAADGHVTVNGGCSISSASLASVEAVRSICAIVGIGYSPISTKLRVGFGTEPTELHKVSISLRDLPEWFFLLPHHVERARNALLKKARERFDWVVEEVSLTDRVEEVFCAVVPGIEAFALADGLMTMNCPHVTNCRGDEPDPATPTDEDLAVAQEYLAAWNQKREAESILDELKPRFAGRPRIPVGDREIGWVGGNTKSETVADVDAALEAYQMLVGPLPTRTEQVVDVTAALEAYRLLAGPLPVKTVTSTTTRSLKVFPASKKRKAAPDA